MFTRRQLYLRARLRLGALELGTPAHLSQCLGGSGRLVYVLTLGIRRAGNYGFHHRGIYCGVDQYMNHDNFIYYNEYVRARSLPVPATPRGRSRSALSSVALRLPRAPGTTVLPGLLRNERENIKYYAIEFV